MSTDLIALGIKDKRLSNGQTMAIREAELGDVSVIIDYLASAQADNGDPLFCAGSDARSLEQARMGLENAVRDDGALMLLGLVEDKIIAFALIRALPGDLTNHNSTISLAVSKSYWNKGIGGAMMRGMIMFARLHPDIKTIHLGVRADNAGLITLYQIYGFHQVGVHKNYYGEDGSYCDRILMDLQVN